MADPHYLALSGDPFTRGKTHGGELRQQVSACVDFYRSILGLGEAALRDRAAIFEGLIDAYSPSLAAEIRGIAQGSGLPAAHLFAINARSELVPFDAAECTVLWAPQTGLLAQTWDWCQQLEELVTLLDITGEDGQRLLTVTEPGMVGKIGLSGAGVGVCLNFLSAPRSGDGVPIHILLREALDAGPLDAARQRLRQAGAGRSGNILLAAAGGEGVNFEFSGDAVDERELGGNFCHTNHCLFTSIPAGELEDNSRGRHDLATALLGERSNIDVNDMKAFLSNRQNEQAPICAPYQPLFGLELGTLCTVVMDLPRRQLHLRLGADPDGAFQHFCL